ncbi:recombinase family protein [Streptomyces sp. NPDC048442]|uniref:recombinase family protein n=1 Tax=Streptomyces sp. NPDC048442 TaxID=3154823 RepID=UPI003441B73D
MNVEGKITTSHRSGLAIIYLRQSTMLQVREHTESPTRQYALVDLALALGWMVENILVIDKDLGVSGRFGSEEFGQSIRGSARPRVHTATSPGSRPSVSSELAPWPRPRYEGPPQEQADGGPHQSPRSRRCHQLRRRT